MIKASISLQDLRRRIYDKAKSEPEWRFWGLYVHVCKDETLGEAYKMAKSNNGAPGLDGVTFDDIEKRKSGQISANNTARVAARNLQAVKEQAERDPQGKRQIPDAWNPLHPRPRSTRSPATHFGAYL